MKTLLVHRRALHKSARSSPQEKHHAHVDSDGVHRLFWPWDDDLLETDMRSKVLGEVIAIFSAVASFSGRCWQIGRRRAYGYRYKVYVNSGRRGSVYCNSLHSIITLRMAGPPAWSINRVHGPFPMSYTWGCHCLNVLRVLRNQLRKSSALVTCMLTRVGFCQVARTHRNLKVYVVKRWVIFWICFHAQGSDLATSFHTYVLGDMVRGISTRLNDISL